MFRQTAWTPRDSNTYADDDWSDTHPSPIHPSYNDASPSSTWLSPVAVGDDADNLFDLTQTNDFCSLLDDSSSRHEQQTMLERWRTPMFNAKSNLRALSRQSTLDDVVVVGGWEEKIVRRFQRKRGLYGLSLREVKREMAPIEFDPAFVDSDTEDEDEPVFNPEMLVDPPMKPVTPRFPSPISIPGPGPFPSEAPLSPLTPLSSEPQHDLSVSPPSPSPPPALVPARALTPLESAADPVPVPERASSPVVKEEMEDISTPSRASPALKRTFSDAILDAENVLADDATSEGEYVPSDDEEDDADPTYGAPKTRRVSSSHVVGHARTASSDKPARTGPGRRRRPVDDAAPSQCTYESPLTGSRCQQIFARLPEMKRHIDHFHHEQEARAVIEGKLPRERATLLGSSWDGTLGKPTCEGCGTEFSRRDAVKRHQNEVKAQFEDGRCVWCPGTQGRKGSAKRVAAAKLASGAAAKRQRRK